MSPSNRGAVEEMGQWIEKNRTSYKEGMAKISDPVWVRQMMRVLKEQLNDVLMYTPLKHEPHVAVFAAGRVQARTEVLFAELDLMDQWEEEKARYDEAVANLPPEEDEESPELG